MKVQDYKRDEICYLLDDSVGLLPEAMRVWRHLLEDGGLALNKDLFLYTQVYR